MKAKGGVKKAQKEWQRAKGWTFWHPFSNTSAKALQELQIFLINGFANIRTTFHQPGSRWWNSASSSYPNLSLSFVVLVVTMNVCSPTQVLSLDSSPVLLMERKENRATEQCSGKDSIKSLIHYFKKKKKYIYNEIMKCIPAKKYSGLFKIKPIFGTIIIYFSSYLT